MESKKERSSQRLRGTVLLKEVNRPHFSQDSLTENGYISKIVDPIGAILVPLESSFLEDIRRTQDDAIWSLNDQVMASRIWL